MRLRLLFTLSLAVIATIMSAQAKYVFYFIGDGMGVGAVSLAQSYNRMVLGSDERLLMMQFPVTSLAWTYSASSPVTDSAAAGTALATGHKTNNGMLGMDADTVAVTSIATTLHDMGYGIGLVTTVAPDDATPASFYAHQPRRSMFYEIGCDAAASGFEFIAGASLRGEKKNGEPTDLLQIMEQNNVAVVHGLDELSQTQSRRVVLLGTNNPSANEIGLTIDSIEGALTLPAMTQACLDHLMANSPDRFFMMVEGGSIDHAGHSNDAATSVRETLTFDQSLRIAYDFYLQHPDETLIVVTADHETGGLALGNTQLGYKIEPSYLQYPRMSKDAFSTYFRRLAGEGNLPSWDEARKFLTDRLGLYTDIPVSEKENAHLKEIYDRALANNAEGDRKGLYNTYSQFTEAVYGLINGISGIGWTTYDHSGAPVPVFAVGVDAQRFSHMTDNTDLPKIILSIATGK